MNTQYAREFLTLVKVKNYLAASEQLFISQASLSRHIMAMEKELGGELFIRSTRSVELSQFGFRFLPYAQRMLDAEESLMASLASVRKAVEGVLNIALFHNASSYGIIALVGGFSRQYPEVRVNISEYNAKAAYKSVMLGGCDFAFIKDSGSPAPENAVRLSFYEDRMVAVLPSGHPAAGEKSIELSRLRGEAFLLPDKSGDAYPLCMKAFREAGFVPREFRSNLSGAGAFDLVACGLCVALQFRKNTEKLAGDGVSVVDITPARSLSICLLYGCGQMTATQRSFLDFAKRFAEGERVGRPGHGQER